VSDKYSSRRDTPRGIAKLCWSTWIVNFQSLMLMKGDLDHGRSLKKYLSFTNTVLGLLSSLVSTLLTSDFCCLLC
jgi:hypothetical protein